MLLPRGQLDRIVELAGRLATQPQPMLSARSRLDSGINVAMANRCHCDPQHNVSVIRGEIKMDSFDAKLTDGLSANHGDDFE